ncbi:SpoIIE family protein phosphatase [Mediterraneibacter glycyrrhizinilyticus]|uniref:SpoIIE family protein phosphatase n=1 Tax=Mediterraneibacter glycyrrhizinilyticus TaxID=342942 RepID=UPI002659CCEB|nr:SpoIIE family protein phosphatase [Mediterraneibacter glycyrrhizinilyticus]MCF2570027.1 SpoIIE family protein phosphatase [Mediterraneibacter glycyrrhizinilyticus]
MNEGPVLHGSPYVEQIEKYAHSLKQLSRTFLGLEEKKKAFSNEEIEEMFTRVREKVCGKCEKCGWCWGENFVHTYQMGYELLSAVDQYGNELNTEVKRKLMQRCIMAPRFLREMLAGFHDARQNIIWVNRIARSRESCAIQMDTFADMIENTTRELENSIFTDERLEKRITTVLKKKGLRVLYTYFFMNGEGKYEIHVTVRSIRKQKVTVKEVVSAVSECVGRKFILPGDSARMIGSEYMTVVCVEGPSFYIMHGTARIGKDCDRISGDNFALMEMPGGKYAVALSDGMGSGETACRESTLVIELLEELLSAGFPEKTAIQMINTTLVIGREEIHYSTVDMTVFDLYSGECEVIKAGASSTFIKKKDSVEHLSSTSLPIGVMNHIEIDSVKRQLEDGDFVIMVTDGVLDALPVGEQDILLETIIQGSEIANPKEMAHHVLEQVLAWTGKEPADDMTVMAVGIWRDNSLHLEMN